MLTAITLENFKGISSSVRIPLKPITLMFGANSSGKSTIIQAIHYAREILERNNVNPDRTQLGGSSIDLGGFHSLVHNHDLSLPIILRFDLDLSTVDLPDYTMWARYMLPDEYANDVAPDISGDVQSAFVELVVMWSGIKGQPILSSYTTGLNGEPIARTRATLDEAQFTLEVNARSPVFTSLFGHEIDFDLPFDAKIGPDPWYDLTTRDLVQVLPYSWDRPLFIEKNPFIGDETFSIYLAQMLLGPGKILQDQLDRFRYVGPIRTIPNRNHEPTLTPDESRWADGIAAWDALYRQEDDSLLIEVHHWMSEERLKTGYAILRDEFTELPTMSPLGAALNSNTLLDDIENVSTEFNAYPVRKRLLIQQNEDFVKVQPPDIGVGISQVVPVIVIALDTRNGIIAIEQPELHLHPAMQAQLGDLFIESAVGQLYDDSVKTKNQFLIETHSEHLILRILRRIRETTASKNTSTAPLTVDDVSLLFISKDSQGTVVTNLRIDEHGRIIDRVPGGFFEEDFAELF
jgi:hypothetical protein